MSEGRELCGEPCPECGDTCRIVTELTPTERTVQRRLGFDPDRPHYLHSARHEPGCPNAPTGADVMGTWGT